jgi:phosphinothricin acetyltransferase
LSRRLASLRIRAGCAFDLPAINSIYNHYVRHTVATMDLEPKSLAWRRDAWFPQFSEDGPHRLLVAALGGRVAGYCAITPFASCAGYARSVELSTYCHPRHRSAGIGSALQRTLLAGLPSDRVHRVYSCITLPNEVMTSMLRKLGFREIGVLCEAGRKFGSWWDMLWMERATPAVGA